MKVKNRRSRETEAKILDFVTIGYNIRKKSLYQGELDDINRQLERPMMPVRTKEELFKKQKELKDIMAEII